MLLVDGVVAAMVVEVGDVVGVDSQNVEVGVAASEAVALEAVGVGVEVVDPHFNTF